MAGSIDNTQDVNKLKLWQNSNSDKKKTVAKKYWDETLITAKLEIWQNLSFDKTLFMKKTQIVEKS